MLLVDGKVIWYYPGALLTFCCSSKRELDHFTIYQSCLVTVYEVSSWEIISAIVMVFHSVYFLNNSVLDLMYNSDTNFRLVFIFLLTNDLEIKRDFLSYDNYRDSKMDAKKEFCKTRAVSE